MKEIFNDLCVAEHYAFRHKDSLIFMDVNTLDVCILDEIENNIVNVVKKSYANNGLKKLKEKYGERVILKKTEEMLINGILKNKGGKNETAVNLPSKHDVNIINSIDILISEDCNLACKYCFVKNGQYHGKSDLMELNVGEKTIDFLIQKSGNRKDMFVCFFGGEPLLNFGIIKKLIPYALEKGRINNKSFHFSITTNATLLNEEIINFISKYQIKVTISIDGDMGSHNKNRPISKGGDSYTQIFGNLKKLNQHNINCAARTTVSSFTKGRIVDNFEHLVSLGFNRIHIENAYAPKGKVFITNKGDIEDIKKQYSHLTKKIIKRIESDQRFNIETIPLPLGKIVNKSMVSHSCKAGRGYVTVDVNGDIYLCHRLVGKDKFLLGNVIEGTYNLKLPKAISNEMNVDNRKQCKKCWARYICGGGCYAVNYEFNKDISLVPGIYCQHKKHTIKSALAIYANAAD